jgi:hypothetical protein
MIVLCKSIGVSPAGSEEFRTLSDSLGGDHIIKTTISGWTCDQIRIIANPSVDQSDWTKRFQYAPRHRIFHSPRLNARASRARWPDGRPLSPRAALHNGHKLLAVVLNQTRSGADVMVESRGLITWHAAISRFSRAT